MADDLVARVHTEIRERLKLSRAAKLESERLEAALAALGRSNTTRADIDGRSGRSRGTPTSSGARRSRARRGANRAAVLAAVEQHPDATPPEIRKASGVEGNTLYGILRTLVERGDLQRSELSGGRFGYRLPVAADASPSEAADTTAEPASSTDAEPA